MHYYRDISKGICISWLWDLGFETHGNEKDNIGKVSLQGANAVRTKLVVKYKTDADTCGLCMHNPSHNTALILGQMIFPNHSESSLHSANNLILNMNIRKKKESNFLLINAPLKLTKLKCTHEYSFSLINFFY